jgi:hypothetical protein
MKRLVILLVLSLIAARIAAQSPATDPLIARAKSLELNTPYVPPPGDPLEHHTSGFAKIMCSAVFITGLDPEFARENVGYFTSPYAERAKVAAPIVDREKKGSGSLFQTGRPEWRSISAARAALRFQLGRPL